MNALEYVNVLDWNVLILDNIRACTVLMSRTLSGRYHSDIMSTVTSDLSIIIFNYLITKKKQI